MNLKLTTTEFAYLKICIEGFLFGVYSGIFAMYLQYHASTERTADNARGILFYALCVLYLLSVPTMCLDLATFVVAVILESSLLVLTRLDITGSIIFGCCDFIAQSILIYRCWIVWRHNIFIVIIPSILAVAYLAMWITTLRAQYIEQGEINITPWGNTLLMTSLATSMTVNALVTGLIVFRIFKVFREVKSNTTSHEQGLGVTRGTKLQSVIFVIIESGMALFSIQLARLVLSVVVSTALNWTDESILQLIIGIHEMLNGITPTIILVRVSMGLSFHDEPSLIEAAGSVLRFAPSDSRNDISQDGGLPIAHDHPIPEMKEGDNGRSDDI